MTITIVAILAFTAGLLLGGLNKCGHDADLIAEYEQQSRGSK